VASQEVAALLAIASSECRLRTMLRHGATEVARVGGMRACPEGR
jgi:hypothetical protein